MVKSPQNGNKINIECGELDRHRAFMGEQMLDEQSRKLLERIKGEIRAIGEGISENVNKQQVQNAVNQAEENISQLISDYGGLATVPINSSEVIRMGGRVGRGTVEKSELQGDVEVRVSMRSSKYLGSVELFTLRNLEPADYHLILAAIPRNKGGENPAWP